ncbi:mitochondrial carrier protein [Ceratobasidium sp. AG-Ba]|nr:mitochondrial carrier protein [Ceratobasidium sp. AG-Ba]QRW03024.1 mitochondrial carrier protein [Ceratobasidium sp. AG-Ba]
MIRSVLLRRILQFESSMQHSVRLSRGYPLSNFVQETPPSLAGTHRFKTESRTYSQTSLSERVHTSATEAFATRSDPFVEARSIAHRYAEENGHDISLLWEENIAWGHLDSFRWVCSAQLVQFFDASRMHMMYMIALETHGPKGAKAILEGLGISIILKSIDVKFKVGLLPTAKWLLVIMQRPHSTSPAQFTLSSTAYSLAQRTPVATAETVCVWYDYDVWKKYLAPHLTPTSLRNSFTLQVTVNRVTMAEEVDYEALPSNAGLGVNMLAGAMAGISEHAVMFPLDSIKTRMQVITANNVAVYSSLGNAVQRIASTEGLRTLWRGVASVIMGAGPAHAVHFGTYEAVKELAGGNTGGHHPGATRACATIASDALMNPFDVIKQRMQIKDSAFRSVLTCARTVYRNEGLTAFYISYPTTLTMSVPFTAVQFTAYESIKRALNPTDQYSPITHVTAGGMAGGIAAAITTPLDVAKTLLQTRGSSNDPQIRNAQGMRDAFRIIYERNGLQGFARGLTPRVVTFMPSNALCWLCYEFFKMAIRTDEAR